MEFLKIGLVELGRVELEARLYMRTDDLFYIARFPRSRNILHKNVLCDFFLNNKSCDIEINKFH